MCLVQYKSIGSFGVASQALLLLHCCCAAAAATATAATVAATAAAAATQCVYTLNVTMLTSCHVNWELQLTSASDVIVSAILNSFLEISTQAKKPSQKHMLFTLTLAAIEASQVTSLCPDIICNLANFVISQ